MSAAYQPEIPGLPVPVVAVVDSWNFRRQIPTTLGSRERNATPDGLVGAFRPYGLDVVDMAFALGVEPAGRPPGIRPKETSTVEAPTLVEEALLANTRTRQRLEKDPRTRVLAGRLAYKDPDDRRSPPIEKLVDVLCAVEIARLAVAIRDGTHPARGILALSRDMDLIPAYRLATELGVPVWAAASSTVDRRQHEHPWMLLDDAAVATSVSWRGHPVGTDLRRLVAGFPARCETTTGASVEYVDHRRGRVMVRCDDGVPGTVPTAQFRYPPPKRTRLELHAASVDPGEEHDFPRVNFNLRDCSPVQPATAVVAAWRNSTSVFVRGDQVTGPLDVPPGYLLPGMRVGVARRRGGALKYIGPLDSRSNASGREEDDGMFVLRTVAPFRPHRSLAVVEKDGREVYVSHAVECVPAGLRIPAFLAARAHRSTGRRHVMMPLGSPLPTPLG